MRYESKTWYSRRSCYGMSFDSYPSFMVRTILFADCRGYIIAALDLVNSVIIYILPKVLLLFLLSMSSVNKEIHYNGRIRFVQGFLHHWGAQFRRKDRFPTPLKSKLPYSIMRAPHQNEKGHSPGNPFLRLWVQRPTRSCTKSWSLLEYPAWPGLRER